MLDRPYVQTYTAVVGNNKCNANCPYCVSKMTPCHLDNDSLDIDLKVFRKGGKLALIWGATTFLITGKGEPTLYPDLVRDVVGEANALGFPIIELQTNGIRLVDPGFDKILAQWARYGLTTVSVSCVHYKRKPNQELISEAYPDLEKVIEVIHKCGLAVRLSVIMISGYIQTFHDVKKFVLFANENDVEQVKFSMVNAPDKTTNEKMATWVRERVPSGYRQAMKIWLNRFCVPIRELVHGDTIYSCYIDGMKKDQNLSYSSCLTESSGNDIRQLIYCRDGHIRYSWQHQAAILF